MENIKEQELEDFTKISLDSIEGFFQGNALVFLKENNILTLDDLFNKSSNPDFIKLFTANNGSVANYYDEIINSVKLLRFKYLKEDLSIDEYSELDELLNKMGFSARLKTCIKSNLSCTNRSGILKSISTDENSTVLDILFSLVDDENRDKKIMRMRNTGAVTAKELITKVEIVKEYFKKEHKDVNNYELQLLYSKLKRLTEESKKISLEIELVQDKINEHKKGNMSL